MYHSQYNRWRTTEDEERESVSYPLHRLINWIDMLVFYISRFSITIHVVSARWLSNFLLRPEKSPKKLIFLKGCFCTYKGSVSRCRSSKVVIFLIHSFFCQSLFSQGLPWGRAAIGNATWSGARLRDVLAWAGVKEDSLGESFHLRHY